jgi:hypothetical protein
MTVAVLFARADSVYKTIPTCDVWDMERDARVWLHECRQGRRRDPVIAHPPCRAWGRLRAFARPRKGERGLAVRAVGGVLEHPEGSLLWRACSLPAPGKRDRFGGWTLGIHQHDFGHLAEKATLLYIVGCDPSDVPPMPALRLDEPTHVIQSRKRTNYRPHVTKADREHTPTPLARWLVELAQRCAAKQLEAA